MSPQVNDQVFPRTESLAAHLAYMGLLARVYSHMDLEISLTRDGLATNLTSNLILPRVYLGVYPQSTFPMAFEVADGAAILLTLPVRSHVHIQVRRTRVGGFADLAYVWFFTGVRENVSLECLLRVEPFAADLTVDHVFLIMFFLVQPQIVSRDF